MNDKEVIERLNRFKTIKVMYGNTFAMHLEQLKQLQQDLEIILNLIEKQKAEIENKDIALRECERNLIEERQNRIKEDKIINLMAEELVKAHEWFYSEFDNYTKEDFIKYFEKKAEEEK